jgi:hypothetical protein
MSYSSVIQKQPLISHQSESAIKSTNSNGKINKRPADFFKGCIEIDDDDDDDDDIQEIERQQ